MKKILALVLVALFVMTGFAMAEEKTLTLATNAAFPPYEYYEYDETIKDNVAVGIDIEISRAVCDKLGYGMEIADIEFGSIIGGVKSGKYDFAAAGMTVTPEREQMVQFTVSYATGIQSVIVPAESAISEIYDLVEEGKKFKIGVQQDTTGDIYTSDEFEAAGQAEVMRFKSGAEAVQALKTGKIDCVVIDNEPAKSFVAVNEGLKILDTSYTEEQYAMAFPKDSAIFADFNAALQELIADGTVQGIINKYIPAE